MFKLSTAEKLSKFIILSVLIVFGLIPSAGVSAYDVSGSIYYVSPLGSDANPGTMARPWKTLNYAAGRLSAGDTLYIRGGIYRETVDFSNSGTNSARISISAFPGEQPVIDGNQNTIPSWDYYPLVKISGSYVTFSGLEVRYSRGMGLALVGAQVWAERINSHHNRENGIVIIGLGNIVSGSRVWSNCMSNFDGVSDGWSAGISEVGLQSTGYQVDAVIRDNVVFGNWGEGISTFESIGTIIEGNTVFDNWSANVYVSNAVNVLVLRNFVYTTGAMTTAGGGNQVGIMMGDEEEAPAPASKNVKIINNIVYQADHNLWWWKCDDMQSGMINVVIANNTLVNSKAGAGITIAAGAHQNVAVKNNIVQQDGSLPVAAVIANSELVFSNNLWSKTPPSVVAGSGDVIGNPGFLKLVSPFSPFWYSIPITSPAVNRAVWIDGAAQDYFKDYRDASPDIGADESLVTTLPHQIYLPWVYNHATP